MSTVTPTTPTPAAGHDAHPHPPHLAHHFDTPEQQFASGKLGMWVFLATEILMFGGLFCAYAVYRHNHPDVFAIAHTALNTFLGGVNTVVLITSSLTMAWAVRAAQLGSKLLLPTLLVATLMGGFGFMGIKAIEYRDKWEHHLGFGPSNQFRPNPAAAQEAPASAATPATIPSAVADPNAGTADAASVLPPAISPQGLSAAVIQKHRQQMEHVEHEEHALEKRVAGLSPVDRDRVYTFFSVYFFMTGLHGLHVLIGMALIFWVLKRSVSPSTRRYLNSMALIAVGLFLIYLDALLGHGSIGKHQGLLITYMAVIGLGVVGIMLRKALTRTAPAGAGEFGPEYFTPVDIVGLYWHLVDLIWIFLFPLLYLIH